MLVGPTIWACFTASNFMARKKLFFFLARPKIATEKNAIKSILRGTEIQNRNRRTYWCCIQFLYVVAKSHFSLQIVLTSVRHRYHLCCSAVINRSHFSQKSKLNWRKPIDLCYCHLWIVQRHRVAFVFRLLIDCVKFLLIGVNVSWIIIDF